MERIAIALARIAIACALLAAGILVHLFATHRQPPPLWEVGAVLAIIALNARLAGLGRLAAWTWRQVRRKPDVAFGLTLLAAASIPAMLLASHSPAGAAALFATAAIPAARAGYGRASPTSLRPSVEGMKWDAVRWPNFTPRELACKCPTDDPKGCKGEYFHDAVFLDALQRLRDLIGKPLSITSGHRCARRNARVGGATRSQHLAIAADISLAGHDPADLARKAAAAGFTGIGFGKTFLHVDMRAGREGFHYPGGQEAWTARFGFDPAARFDATGKL